MTSPPAPVAPAVRFAVIGLEHDHAIGITAALLGGGATLAGFHSDNELAAELFEQLFDRPPRVARCEEIHDDDTIDVVVAVGVPAERAAVAAAAMRAGKDVLVAKPAVTTPAQLDEIRSARAESDRIFAVWFSERLESRATARASTLVRAGAIGDVVQVVGFGPHRLDLANRPSWFLDPARQGGILNDLASHQLDQFLHFAGSDDGDIAGVEIVAAMVANRGHPDHPGLEDYGEVTLRTADASGAVRVDWFTPAGLPSWGDVRLFVLGTAGYLEARKNCDLTGRDGGDHLLLVDDGDVHRFDCAADELTFVSAFLNDVTTRDRTHMDQDHCLAVCELALRAQAGADRFGHLAPPPTGP